jgi:hypothetical protein
MNDHTITADVVGAILKVMAGVKTLGKEDTNKFQKYDFVSVDQFLAAPKSVEAIKALADRRRGDLSQAPAGKAA